MADVTLKLVADNSQYIAKMKEAQTATQKVYDTAEKGSVKQRGLIERELQTQKQLSDQRNKAQNLDSLTKYNQLLDDSKKRLEDLEKAGVSSNEKTKKSSDNLIGSIGKMALAYLSVHTVIKFLSETVFAFYTKSQEGMHLLEQKTAAFKAGLSVLRGEFIKFGEAINDSLSEKSEKGGVNLFQKLGASVKYVFNILTMGVPKYVGEKTGITSYFKDLKDRVNEAGFAAENYTKKEQQLYELETAMIKPRAEANLKIKEARNLYLDESKSIDEKMGYLKSAIALENEAANKEIAHQKEVVANMQVIKIEKQKVKQWFDSDERVLQEAIAKGIDLETESYGRQRFALTEVNALKKQAIADDKALNDLMEELNQIMKADEDANWEFGLGIGKQNFDAQKKVAKEAAKLIDDNLKKQKDADEELAKMKTKSLEKIGKALVDYMSILDELTQKEVDRTQRERELLDTRIDEAQTSLNTEVELYKAGYASNVAAKQKEIEGLKKQRDLALLEEEKARKRQHTIEVASLLAQKAVDIAKIISSTAVANAKAVALSPLTFGQPWVAVNTVAAALGIAADVAAVIAASTAKYAKGGWTGDGRQRDETGERMAGIVHEREFVVRRGPAHKFRDVLEAINRDDRRMIFNRFNKLSPELMGTTVNNVVVENEGSNSRLDKLIAENKKLNAKLSNESFQDFGNRIVIKKGNSIRTIRI
jgi:hypothetical protein